MTHFSLRGLSAECEILKGELVVQMACEAPSR